MKSLPSSILTITILSGVLMAATQASAIEKPKHEVVQSLMFEGQSIEIRDYAPYLVAETVVESPSLGEASNEGFRRLAKYIFGGNRSRESMDMTAPVGTIGEAGKYTISFVMPSKYTLETLPVPNDDRITLRAVPSKRVAALVFSGFWSDSNFSRRIQALRAYLAAHQLPEQSLPMIARYNMPLTPWFLRTNEILIDILHP